MTGHRQPRCVAMLKRVSSYLDGELDEAACREIETHCADCPDCAAVIDSLRQTIGLCRATGERPLPVELRARAQASIARLLGASKQP